uniref:Protein kinase domain-containing protein n=1 Tax=Quercus lobata TaxID=97700 RepID=A0A7N2MUM5_QUELO
MALNSRVLSAFFCIIFVWSFLEISNGVQSDIDCLKSIKHSLEDPYGYLNSWNFNNITEGFLCNFNGVGCWHDDENKVLDISLSNMGLRGQFPRGIKNGTRSIPAFGNASFQADSFANNERLCGRALKPCKTPKRGLKFDFSFKGGFVVDYVVSTVSAMTIFMSYYVVCINDKKRDKKKTLSKERTSKNEEKEAEQVNQSQTQGLLQEATKKNSQFEGMVTKMNFTKLSKATNNFSIDNAIGVGKMGVMYKAVLPNGSPLAVKRLHGCQSFEKNFICELLALDRLRHNNIIPLLGFCRERTEKLLVYQYISNGNLYDWLHAKEGNDKILEWPLRIKIMIGIARGLAWLHHNSEGILFIDSNDSNSSNSSFVDSGVWELGFVKKDVYDFGILLIELIIGKEPIQINNFSNNLNRSLADWITHLLSSSSDLYSVIDKSLIGRGYDGEIFQFLRIACTCLNCFPSQRPTMFELYNTVSTLGERYGIANDSELLRQIEIATASTSNEIVSVEIA